MTATEAARLLAAAALIDKRTVDENDAQAWAHILGDVTFADALPAVTAYYRNSGDRPLMPSDVISYVKANARQPWERTVAEALEGLPPRGATSPGIEAAKAECRAILAGRKA